MMWAMARVECRGILFDLDGVLIDSNAAVDRVWNVWAREHGLNAADVIHKAHGRPSIATVREYIADEAAAQAEHKELVRREIADIEGIVPMPGALKLLESLAPEQWAIVTSGTHELATTRIKAAGLPMPKNLVTSSDIVNGKPYPEPYLKGAMKLGVPAADCIVVEDAGTGVRAGKAAGARVIGVRSVTIPDAELLEAGADWFVQDCSAITVEPGTNASRIALAVQTL
jgi:sugar-phosphatase